MRFPLTRDNWHSRLLAASMPVIAGLIVLVSLFGFSSNPARWLGFAFAPILVVGYLAYRIHLRDLERKTKQYIETSRIHLATVEALATAIDARDQVGIGHARRTQIFAVGIGRILGLTEDDIDALRTGALLHDIGKLAVPDHILNKPGRLTPAEIEKTKTHASVGASILEKVHFPSAVVPTVRYHHEAWDGSGYPEGLKGNNIPLTARILSVADAYDTLRGARPYRPAVSREEACKYLRAGAGTRFDPTIVDLFLRNLMIFEDEIAAQGLAYEAEKAVIGRPLVSVETGASPSYVEQIKRANREVFTLYSLAREFSSALDLKETLSLFTDKIHEIIPFDTAAVFLIDGTGDFATAAHIVGTDRSAISRRIKVAEGRTGYVLKKALPLQNENPAEDFSSAAVAVEYRSMASIPLMADEILLGAISLYSKELDKYQDEHLRLLETVSRIAADAITKSLQHAEAENYALTDPMTGLPNARSLQMHFEKEAKRAGRNGTGFHLLVLDLDGFKAVNDTYGHKIGDRMLKEISNVLRAQLRDYDLLARYGGDEFVAILPESNGADIAELAHRIEDAVNRFFLPVSEDTFAKVGVSLGAACYPANGESFDQLIIAADKAMYAVKANHKKQKEAAAPTAKHAEEFVWDGSAPTGLEDKFGARVDGDDAELVDGLIVELDETHIVASAAVN